MLVLHNTGEFKAYILESPKPRAIEAAYPYSLGFIVAVADNFYFFAADDSDEERAPLVQINDAP
jgi:hypothetical protein